MSLDQIVRGGVNTAFKILNDNGNGLTTELTFSLSESRNYDFSTGGVSVNSETTVTVTGVILQLDTETAMRAVESLQLTVNPTAQFIINLSSFPDSRNLKLFDEFTANGVTYSVLNMTNNGYVVEGLAA